MGKKDKVKAEDNFLELKPYINENVKWGVLESGLVQITIPRNGVFDRLVRVFRKTPQTMSIELDAIGTHVWLSIHEGHTVGEIAHRLKAEETLQVEPLYERLSTYIQILKNNAFIELQKV